MENQTKQEEFKINGEDLVAKLKDIINQGNIRRIIIKNDKGVTLIEVPLTIGVVGAVFLPVWAAIGAIAAMITNCTVVVERRVTPEEKPESKVTEG